MKRLPLPDNLHSTFFFPVDGVLFYRHQPNKSAMWNGRFAGKVAGSKDGRHISVKLDGISFRAHRIIWKMWYGAEPHDIDHIDGNGRNNNIENLRECTHSQNMANAKGYAKSGLKGAYRRKSGWISQIVVDRKRHYLGFFKTAEDAHKAYVAAAQKHFGEFARAA